MEIIFIGGYQALNDLRQSFPPRAVIAVLLSILGLTTASVAHAGKQILTPIPKHPHPAISKQHSPIAIKESVRGVTVTLSNLRWQPSVLPPPAAMLVEKQLAFDYHVSASSLSQAPADKNWTKYLDQVEVFRADGSRVAQIPCDATPLPTLHFPIDPHETTAFVEMTFRDVKSTGLDTGTVESSATFRGLPIPRDPGDAYAVRQEVVTPMGTRLIVEKIGRPTKSSNRRDAGDAKNIIVFYRAAPRADHPDLAFRLQTKPLPALTEDWDAAPQSSVSIGPETLTGDPATLNLDVRTMSFPAAPSAGARSLTLTIPYRETSLRARKPSAYRRFRFALNLAAAKDIPARFPELTTITQEGDHIDATLESIQLVGGQYQLRLLINDRAGASKRRWRVDQVQMIDDAANIYRFPAQTAVPRYWTQQGKMTAPSEQIMDVVMDADEIWGAPRTCTVKFLLTAMRADEHYWNLEKIAIPRMNERAKRQLRVRDDSGYSVALNEITLFTPDSPVSNNPRLADQRAGLAAFFQTSDPQWDYYSCVAANTNDGYHLERVAPIDSSALWASQEQKKPRDPTRRGLCIVLGLPPPTSKYINIRIRRTEELSLGIADQVTFTDIPLPPRKK